MSGLQLFHSEQCQAMSDGIIEKESPCTKEFWEQVAPSTPHAAPSLCNSYMLHMHMTQHEPRRGSMGTGPHPTPCLVCINSIMNINDENFFCVIGLVSEPGVNLEWDHPMTPRVWQGLVLATLLNTCCFLTAGIFNSFKALVSEPGNANWVFMNNLRSSSSN